MASGSETPKRGREVSPTSVTATKRPRLEHGPGTTTHRVWQEFRTRHDLVITVRQFTTLCAYLCTVLQWGYQIDAADLDGFIHQYPEFDSQRADFEAQQVGQETVCIPAFHQWYLQHKQQNTTVPAILDEDTLRNIWSENPYSFLNIYHRLRHIAQEKREHRTRVAHGRGRP